MSKSVGVYTLPEDAKNLLNTYEQFYQATNGSVTPLIGDTMEQAGYDTNYSLVAGDLTSPPTWGDSLHYEYPNLEIKNPVMLDFGAAGKGYLTDIIGELLKSFGVTSFCIDAGGDILQQSEDNQFLEIGLENPSDTTQVIGIVKINNQSLCASAGNRRKWEGFTHIIDPHTKTSPENILATWVIAKTGLLADGLSTCLFFTNGKQLQSQFNFEYLILYKDHSIESSKQFNAELFLK
jgi:thiamine biosynthesis lipoprotein